MNTRVLEDYVQSTARLLALPLDDAQVARVAAHLQRTHAMAQALLAVPLPADTDPAEVYRPAPFPPGHE